MKPKVLDVAFNLFVVVMLFLLLRLIDRQTTVVGNVIARVEAQESLDGKLIELNRTFVNMLDKIANVVTSGDGRHPQGANDLVTKDINARLSSLEAALRSSPEKAYEVALLRKDVETLQGKQKDDVTTLRGDLSKSTDLLKWILGIIAAGLIGPQLGRLVAAKKDS